jgi:hypothetical protein
MEKKASKSTPRYPPSVCAVAMASKTEGRVSSARTQERNRQQEERRERGKGCMCVRNARTTAPTQE